MFNIVNLHFKNIVNIENLTILKNKTTCILGESGCGKTTFLKMLNKILTPDKGEIFFKSRNIKEISAVSLRRKAVMLSQTPFIFEGTIRDNLNAGLFFSEKEAANDERLSEALKAVSLNKNLSEYAENLSGGERGRLCLARIMVMEPEAVLLDEPSSSLDKKTETFVMENFMNFIKLKNITAVIVSHSQNIAENFSDILLKMKNGSISELKRLK